MDFHLINGKVELCQIEGVGKENGKTVWLCKTHNCRVIKVFIDSEEK